VKFFGRPLLGIPPPSSDIYMIWNDRSKQRI